MPATMTTASTAGVKRKPSAAGLSGSIRPVKRRASKACHCCRSRKVRCDVVESGIPCTNCRLDEVECVVTEGKRRKKSYIEGGDATNHSPIESIEEKEELQKFPLFDDIDGLGEFTLPTTQHISRELPDVSNLEFELSHHRPHSIYQTQAHRLTPEERTRRMSNIMHVPRMSLPQVQLPPHLQYHPPAPARPEIVLPQYISPIPRQFLSEDLEYLQKKGAFFIPEVTVRNELLRSYVQYVHPFLPLLDLEEFLSAIEKNQPSNTVSLLLYHAVMFAASAYIDMRYLTSQGFTSRKAARKAYFQRVKLLYDFDWEVDRVTVVQAVLLMTHWYESPNDPKDVWYWLGIAISIARTIGLNYNTEGTAILTPQKQRLWKRIWWSTYLRDRVIAIGMRRPIRIRDEDFDVPVLKLDDFETAPLPPELCRMLGGCSAIRDGSKRETLAKMCIALTEVCRQISDVLAIQYSLLGNRIGVTSETTVRLVPRAAGADTSEVVRCDGELEDWYGNLPQELRYFKPGTRERTTNHDGEAICVHRALLTAVYLTTSSALHRPQMMPAMPNLVIAPEVRDLSRRRVHEAALDTTEIYRDLYTHDLIRFLPNTGVTVLLPAIIIHLLDIKSSEGQEKQTSLRHFQFCMQALQKLRELYASADFSFSYLDAAIRKADVPTDDQSPHMSSTSGASTSGSTESSYAPHRAEQNDHTLTPPPDKHESAERYIDQSLLGSDKRHRFSALTPPSSSDQASMNSGVSTTLDLKELEQFVRNSTSSNSLTQPFPNLEAINLGSIDSYDDLQPTSLQNGVIGHSVMAPMNDFDQLMSLEAGPDLFAPNQVNIDDNLFKDIDMEWLADTNEDEDGSASDDGGIQPSPVSRIGKDESKAGQQLATPPSSNATPTTDHADKDSKTETDMLSNEKSNRTAKIPADHSLQAEQNKTTPTAFAVKSSITGDLEVDMGITAEA